MVRSPSSHGEHTEPRRTSGTLIAMVVDCDGIDVALVPWPGEESVAVHLARIGQPRVLLVGTSVDPPDVHDILEDWVRVPADHRDVEVRARRLARIVVARRSLVDAAGRTAHREASLADSTRGRV